jgi:flagellar basal body P-ring protein FlgI
MNHRESVCARTRGLGLKGGALLALLALAGCMNQKPRLQSADETEHDRYEVKTIGEVTTVGNVVPRTLEGVGLVVGLEGTGAEATRDQYRAMLEDQLKKRQVQNIKDELNSPNHALVLVSVRIQPGACKGDPADVEVKLPPRSRVQSLRGGYLRECYLFECDTTHNLSPTFGGAEGLVLGHKLATAEGPVLVGLGGGDGEGRLKVGRVWNGARLLDGSPLLLLLNEGSQEGRIAERVADRINTSFSGGPRDAAGAEVAHAKDNMAVALRVPPQYRYNLPRFLRVVRLIPLYDTVDGTGTPDRDHRSYRQRLTEDLLDPSRTVATALRLEALGTNSIAALKTGLESPKSLVRFCAAEALTYLGSGSGCDELALAARSQPMFRGLALTALGSLDEAVTQIKLAELLSAPLEDEARYGAFFALRRLNDHSPTVQGENVNDSFWLHRTAPASPPLVHIACTDRPEIVLFGEAPHLKKPFALMAGSFTLTASDDDTRCMVSRFVPERVDPVRRQCSFDLYDVIHSMADLKCAYPEVVEMLREAQGAGCVSCRVCVDALPRNASVYDLQKSGSGTLELKGAPSGSETAAPILYDGPAARDGKR